MASLNRSARCSGNSLDERNRTPGVLRVEVSINCLSGPQKLRASNGIREPVRALGDWRPSRPGRSCQGGPAGPRRRWQTVRGSASGCRPGHGGGLPLQRRSGPATPPSRRSAVAGPRRKAASGSKSANVAAAWALLPKPSARTARRANSPVKATLPGPATAYSQVIAPVRAKSCQPSLVPT